MGVASVVELSELLTDDNYKIYNERKQKIRSKYPEDCFPNYIPDGCKTPPKYITSLQRKQYQKYLKEIGNLLFEPGGDYQKFSWDYLTPPAEKKVQAIRARGKLKTVKY